VAACLRRRLRERWIAAVSVSAILSLLVLAMIGGRPQLSSLAWNLFLAWIPFGLAFVAYQRARFSISIPALAVLAALWLLFLPNAPYMITDLRYANLEYLGGRHTDHVLYDVVLLSAAALAGLLLALTSLFLMHAVARRRVGVAIAWAFVVGAIALGALGTYLGRVKRWNSWDFFTRPESLVGHATNWLLHPLYHSRPLALTALFASFLLASYFVFYSFVRIGSSMGEEPGSTQRPPRG
jgi:uncharacterized membrane protein